MVNFDEEKTQVLYLTNECYCNKYTLKKHIEKICRMYSESQVIIEGHSWKKKYVRNKIKICENTCKEVYFFKKVAS